MKKVFEYSKTNSINFNIKNKTGNTALHYACITGNFALVEYLVETCQADPNVYNVYGQRPIDLCKKNK